MVHAQQTYPSLMLSALRRHPDRTAFADENGSVTYAELERQIAHFVSVFRGAGLKRGDGVALLSGNRHEVFSAMVATLALGCRYTPLHPMGSVADHAAVLADAEADALVVAADAFASHASHLAAAVPGLRLFTLGPADVGLDLLAGEPVSDAPLVPCAEPDDVAFVSYTGGTTGRPKGVMLTHRSLVTNLFQVLAEWQLPDEMRFLAVTPISHAAGLLALPTFVRGGTFHLLPSFDPPRVLQTIEEQGITATFLVPTMIYVLLDVPAAESSDLSSLRTILYGAAPMSTERLKQALDVFGPVFVQLYGQTECPNTIATLGKQDHTVEMPHRLASCGRPVIGNTIAILDERCEQVPVGDLGEICVRGPLVMQGYWRQPEVTADAFRGGWLHTGDMGRLDEDGYLYLVDRKKDLVITGGFNVYPREVEDVLHEHPGVAAATVIGVPDDKWGEAVTAFVVRRAVAEVSEQDLLALVKARKGSVHAPKRIEFVDSLPMTPLGKIDKKAVRAAFWEGQARAVH
jgi:fatty-acyl-CoA synthase